ncbi:hypothetical protein [Paenibacillus plantiphilus]|nr:hypothetical protein [Paenibacillus plantiphilus]
MGIYHLPEELPFNSKILVLDTQYIESASDAEAYIILDLERKFEDPDLNKIPAKVVLVDTMQKKYMLFKYNVVLGDLRDYDQYSV